MFAVVTFWELQSVIVFWPMSSYNAWWQRHIRVCKQLSKKKIGHELNPRPLDRKPDPINTALSWGHARQRHISAFIVFCVLCWFRQKYYPPRSVSVGLVVMNDCRTTAQCFTTRVICQSEHSVIESIVVALVPTTSDRKQRWFRKM